jgi:hypothetical protein
MRSLILAALLILSPAQSLAQPNDQPMRGGWQDQRGQRGEPDRDRGGDWRGAWGGDRDDGRFRGDRSWWGRDRWNWTSQDWWWRCRDQWGRWRWDDWRCRRYWGSRWGR